MVNAPASDNATPLLIAAQEGHAAIVAVLLHYGADANIAAEGDRAVPLQYAVCNGHIRYAPVPTVFEIFLSFIINIFYYDISLVRSTVLLTFNSKSACLNGSFLFLSCLIKYNFSCFFDVFFFLILTKCFFEWAHIIS